MDPDGAEKLTPLHAVRGTVVPAFLDRSVWAGEGEIPPARLEPSLSLAVPCFMPQPCPRYLWVMSRSSLVPRCSSGSVQAPLRGLSPLPHGRLSRAVPAGVGWSREQDVNRLGVPIPLGRGRLRHSGPPRPGIGSAGRARQCRSMPIKASSGTAGYSSVWSSIFALKALGSMETSSILLRQSSGLLPPNRDSQM